MLRGLPLMLTLALQASAHAQTPRMLYVSREFWKPGHEAVLRRIEAKAASVCIGLGVPHPYLGIESVTGSKEVWYINGFSSDKDLSQVNEAYTKNQKLTAAMSRFALQRAAFESRPAEQGAAIYRPDLSVGPGWTMGRDPFLVIVVTKNKPYGKGTVFEAQDGEHFVVTSARTWATAKASQSSAGSEAKIFVVRPEFSMPATEWVESDPALWKSSQRDTHVGEFGGDHTK